VRSLGGRLTLLFVTLTGVILAAFCVSLYIWARDAMVRDLEKDLDSQTLVLRQRVQEEYGEFLRGVHPDIRPELQSLLEASGAEAEIRRKDGTIFWVSKDYDPTLRSRVDRVPLADGEEFTLRLVMSEDALRDSLRRLALYCVLFFPMALVLSAILGQYFVKKALSPLEEIRRHAERISRAHMSERVPEPSSGRELADLARTFNEMLERLESAIQDLQNFAADAAHELRTPLANLRAEVETAVQQVRPAEEYQRILGSFGEEVARMNRIVTDLFTIAKIDMRQYALQKERVRLRPLLEEARETWEASAARRTVEIRVEGEDAEVAADPVALRRVFMNLVENAVKYNREGGRVILSIIREPGRVRVRVADTGIGISAEHLPRLFRRFYRVDKARSRESGGAGLGLAICKAFIEAHEGTIEATSAPGEGTAFTVTLSVLG